MEMIRQIYDKEGLGAFFKGVLPNLILVINPIINFVVYEFLKKIAIRKYKKEKLIPYSTVFTMSSVGKCMATLATYPILTLRVKLQADKSTNVRDKREEPQDKVDKSILGNFTSTKNYYNKIGGIAGLYKGL